MASAKRRYSKEEFAQRGDAAFENHVLPQLKTEDEGKFAAIDIESGNYAIDVDELAACDKLSARLPEAQIWLVRLGSRYLHRFGGRERVGTALLSGYELKMQIRSRGKLTIKRLTGR